MEARHRAPPFVGAVLPVVGILTTPCARLSTNATRSPSASQETRFASVRLVPATFIAVGAAMKKASTQHQCGFWSDGLSQDGDGLTDLASTATVFPAALNAAVFSQSCQRAHHRSLYSSATMTAAATPHLHAAAVVVHHHPHQHHLHLCRHHLHRLCLHRHRHHLRHQPHRQPHHSSHRRFRSIRRLHRRHLHPLSRCHRLPSHAARAALRRAPSAVATPSLSRRTAVASKRTHGCQSYSTASPADALLRHACRRHGVSATRSHSKKPAIPLSAPRRRSRRVVARKASLSPSADELPPRGVRPAHPCGVSARV